ncbi:hypothetical protein [Pandoraea sp. ISTKB]|uniref:hypothetical protein n=1 Tax=Pandoraea sp. ISTKB TaxID=1586708 RepID=UPI000846EFBE|nr:hypothetical protein [Pandoraea sp. ISTKB]ODP32581.1 hypothetical protein A9762_22075 [Pandoraea sp. ISTKB]
MNAMSWQAESRACSSRGVVSRRFLSRPHFRRRFRAVAAFRFVRLIGLTAVATLAGCAALDPGNWQVVGPPASYVRPAPVIVAPAPAIVAPAPIIVTPAPAVISPAPVIVTPAPAITRPAPVIVTPAPTIVGPAPVIVTPAPVIVGPRPPVVIAPAQPRSSRDAAHFLRERCYLEKGGCYTSEYREGYEFNPHTGGWDWVGQRDYHWKGSRGNR